MGAVSAKGRGKAFALNKLCALPMRMCIYDEANHHFMSRPIGIKIFSGNDDRTQGKCTPSGVIEICPTGKGQRHKLR